MNKENAKIVLFTDLHYGNNVEKKYGKNGVNIHGKDIRDLIIKLRDEIKETNPSLIFDLGDSVQANSADEARVLYKEMKAIFKGLKIHNLYGNHETDYLDPGALREILAVEPRFSFEKDGLKHIIFDAYKTGNDGEVEMTEDSLDWLRSELKPQELRSIAYCHYPVSGEPDNLGYWHKARPHQAFIKQAKLLRELFVQSNVLACISGHTHFYFNKNIGGMKYLTIPSFAEDEDGAPSARYAVLELPSLDLDIKQIKLL